MSLKSRWVAKSLKIPWLRCSLIRRLRPLLVSAADCWIKIGTAAPSPVLQTKTVALLKAQNGVTAQQSSYGGVVPGPWPGRGGGPIQRWHHHRARARVNPAAGSCGGVRVPSGGGGTEASAATRSSHCSDVTHPWTAAQIFWYSGWTLI